MAVDSDARTQLGNVLSVLPKKLQSFAAGAGYDFTSEVPVMENLFAVSDDQMSYISLKDSGGNLAWQMVGGDDGSGLKRFSPTAGYDFSSEIPASANLFAVSDAGLSYVSESDDQGVLSWRLVGDESTDIKRFEAPADYDFKSTDPTSENLLGVDPNGISYLSVQSSAGGGGAQVPVGPTTFDMDLGSAGTSDWGGGMASFTYQGLDSNGYPYWEEDSNSSFRVEWFTDFTATVDYDGSFPSPSLSNLWGYVLTYNGSLAGDDIYGHSYIAHGSPSPPLPAGEFWDLRDSGFTYTSVAGNDISVTLETSTMFGSSAYPRNFNGTETEGGGGGGASLSWQKIGSDGTEIKRFSPTAGYDFSSEIPTSANLFAVSDAGLSYVSESDDQGALSWRLVGDESTDIKSFTPPNGYDFTSEIPSSPNLLAVDSNGATFLSAQGAGTSINIGPSSFNIIVGAMGATADFNYAGLDSAGYPHWAATVGYSFGSPTVVDYKIVWRSDEWVNTHGNNMTGWFVLDSSGNVMTMSSPDTDGALLVALHSETVGVLVDGEFWELSDSLYGTSSAGTYTSKSSTSVSIYWNDDLGGFASPSGTETSVTAGAITWQALRDDGTEIKRFSPTAGYDFSSEVPVSANLFAVSDAGLSYVSESDDQGVLSWRLVGDESTDIKRFTAPDGYDFKSELPTEGNLLGTDASGVSYLSVEQEGESTPGDLAGPDTVQVDTVGNASPSDFKTFVYSGLDVSGYPHWLANDGSNYKISWLSSFDTGGGGNKTGWFMLNDTDEVVNVFGFSVGLAVVSDSSISLSLSTGEFWPLSDAAYSGSLSYTTDAGETLSLEWLPMPLAGFNASSGTANVAVIGPKVLAWQVLGGDGTEIKRFVPPADYDFSSAPSEENLFAKSSSGVSYISGKDDQDNLVWSVIGGDGTEIKRFTPAPGYNFSSEVPTSANLFAVSDAGLSYVSESDDQGVLSWRLVGDESADIKKFTAPDGYDFKSELPTEGNLLGTDTGGVSYLSAEQVSSSGVSVGPQTLEINLSSASVDNNPPMDPTFAYVGLDSNGYPYWENGSEADWKIEWMADFTAVLAYGQSPTANLTGYVVTYQGSLATIMTDYGTTVCVYAQSPNLSPGEFWAFSDSAFTYDSAAGESIQVLDNYGNWVTPQNLAGTATATVATSSLAWQVLGGGGGGFGEGSSKGGPIFVTGAYSNDGAVSIEGDLQYGTVWTGMSTPEDSVSLKILVERGDAQNYKPTGVLFYQTGQAGEVPNESSPSYVSPGALSLSDNGYSWEADVAVSSADSVMNNNSTYYLFFNGQRSTEINIKRTSLPSVQSATFANKDGSHGEEPSSSNGIYPKVGSVANGFTTPDGSTGFDGYDQSSVKSGDEVKLEIITDKPIDAVIFSSTEGAIRSLEINSASFYNGMPEDNGDGTWTSYIVTNINDSSPLSAGTNFTIKVKDEKGNLSESWYNSDNTIDINNGTPSVTISSVSYPDSNLAIGPGGASASYTISAVDLDSLDDYFQFELTDSSLAGLGDDHIWNDGSLLQDGQVIYVDVESPTSPEQTISPFTLKILRMTNGSISTFTSPSVLIQDSSDPVLSLSVDAVRSGPSGNEDEITITSNVSLKSLSDTNLNHDVFSDGTVISGSSAAQEINSKTWKIKIKSFDSAVRESAFDVLVDLEKYSGSSSQTTVASQVRGFVQREISKNGVEALSEIPIGAVVVNPAKIKSKGGLMENLTLKVNSGNESNVPFNSAVSSSNLGGGVGAEFGLSTDSSSIILDSDARAQWSPQESTTVYITLEELI